MCLYNYCYNVDKVHNSIFVAASLPWVFWFKWFLWQLTFVLVFLGPNRHEISLNSLVTKIGFSESSLKVPYFAKLLKKFWEKKNLSWLRFSHLYWSVSTIIRRYLQNPSISVSKSTLFWKIYQWLQLCSCQGPNTPYTKVPC